MSVSDATLKALKQLGLTEYETQAYLALVDGGQMAASDLSAKSKLELEKTKLELAEKNKQIGRKTIHTSTERAAIDVCRKKPI